MSEKPLWDRILPIVYAFPPGDARGLAIRGLSNEAKALEKALSTSRARVEELEGALKEIARRCDPMTRDHERSGYVIGDVGEIARSTLSPKGGSNG